MPTDSRTPHLDAYCVARLTDWVRYNASLEFYFSRRLRRMGEANLRRSLGI